MGETINQKGSEQPTQWSSLSDNTSSWQEHLQTLQNQAEPRPEQAEQEKSFFETNTEFDGQQIKEFIEKLLNADEETTRQIIDSRIALMEEKCDDSEEISPIRQVIHRGYIGSKTNVRFEAGFGANLVSRYKLRDTAYLHEAVNSIQQNKESIRNGVDLFKQVEGFLNSYFGIPEMSDASKRDDVIEQKNDLNNPKWSGDEYWDILDNVDISVFKGEHVAMCSERTAMAQNILSLFGYETYFVYGDVDMDGEKEDHAFNVIADNTGTKYVIDFSVTSIMEYMGTNWILPTPGKINDFDSFSQGNTIQTYTYTGKIANDGSIKRTPTHRLTYHART